MNFKRFLLKTAISGLNFGIDLLSSVRINARIALYNTYPERQVDRTVERIMQQIPAWTDNSPRILN